MTPRALSTSPYYTPAEAADYLRKPNAQAFLKWARRQGVRECGAKMRPLFHRADLDRAIGLEPARGSR